jgi:hypothetical protein
MLCWCIDLTLLRPPAFSQGWQLLRSVAGVAACAGPLLFSAGFALLPHYPTCSSGFARSVCMVQVIAVAVIVVLVDAH